MGTRPVLIGGATSGPPPRVQGSAAGDVVRPAPPDFTFGHADFDLSDEEDPDAWTPDPIDADPLLPARRSRGQDVISLLVGIYGSKETFIKEYVEMLSDRLLGAASYMTERESNKLELLKTRFGEAALAQCEVMLQDIRNSKSINERLQQQSIVRSKSAPAVGEWGSLNATDLCLTIEKINALILSRHYWPSGFDDHPHVRLPEGLEKVLVEYGNLYAEEHSKRSLTWQKSLGVVEATVHFADRSLPAVASPTYFAVLSCFEAEEGSPSPRLTLEDVALKLDLPEVFARKRLGFWVSKGFLREPSPSVFEVQESLSASECSGPHLDDDMESSPSRPIARVGKPQIAQ